MPTLEGTPELPHELGPGQGQTFTLPYERLGLATGLADMGVSFPVQLRAWCADMTGNHYFSMPITFSVEKIDIARDRHPDGLNR